MVQVIKIIKVGNHWYPDVNHFNPIDLILDSKTDRILNKIDIMGLGQLHMYITDSRSILGVEGVIQFNANDIDRYLTTEDDFIMTMYVDDHEFQISSELYSILVERGIIFHEHYYSLEIW